MAPEWTPLLSRSGPVPPGPGAVQAGSSAGSCGRRSRAPGTGGLHLHPAGLPGQADPLLHGGRAAAHGPGDAAPSTPLLQEGEPVAARTDPPRPVQLGGEGGGGREQPTHSTRLSGGFILLLPAFSRREARLERIGDPLSQSQPISDPSLSHYTRQPPSSLEVSSQRTLRYHLPLKRWH